jgi:hypothetical protein
VEVFEMPHGNFDKPPETMKISNSGALVEACGPLSWNGDADGDGGPARKVTVTHVNITQQSSGAHANHQANELSQPPTKDWMVRDIPCQGPQRFEDGPAEAFAKARVELNGGQIRPERWPENGTITVELSSDGT